MSRFLITVLLSVLPIIIVETIIYHNDFRTFKITLEVQTIESLNGQTEQISSEFGYVVSDLMFLADLNELHSFLSSNETKQRTNLVREYRIFSSRKKIYDQIRFFDTTGMEIVRVNFDGNTATVVPEDKLQNKGKRYYFQDAFILNRSEVFVSPLDLNIEQGQIEQPLKPMIRFGTPVFNQNGEKRGIVLLNYLGANLLNKLGDLAANASSEVMLLNNEGFWLRGATPKNEWGFMYEDGKDKTFGNAFPDAWQQINQTESGQFYTDDGLFTFITVYPLIEGYKSSTGSSQAYSPSDSSIDTFEYHWKVVSYVPTVVLQAKSQQILSDMAIPFFVLVLLMVVTSSILTHVSLKHVESKEQLHITNITLLKANRRMKDELDLAKDIQQSLLPPCSPIPKWSNIDVMCHTTAAREVGGDFYSHHIFNDNHYVLAIGDVSGKGVSAALLMAASLSQLDSSFSLDLSPTERLAHLDKALLPYTKPRRQNCALCYVEIMTNQADIESNSNSVKLCVTNAGGISPYIKRQDGSVEWLEVGGMPLGIGLSLEFGYEEIEAILSKNDVVILTSDGIVEAMNANRDIFGFVRLRNAIETAPSTNPQAILNHLLTEVINFTGNTDLHDDLTIIVVQV